MLTIVHLLVGGLVGRILASSLILVIIIAFVSHYLLDFIPHWNPKTFGYYIKKKNKIAIFLKINELMTSSPHFSVEFP